MKKLIIPVQWIVGLLFIFSGLIKANDPLGLSYKMQEFFEVWGWKGLDGFTLPMSIIMNTFEVVAGVAIIVGWRRKLFTWLLLLLIIFFTFLTGYALLSGKIKTCGCFGDCIPLKASQSFAKDIILFVLIVILVINQSKITSIVKPAMAFSILALSTLGVLGLQWYVLKHLPVVDCLPYKKGNNLQEQMKIPANAVPDSTVMIFKYKKEGKIVEVGAEKAGDLDSTYEFVSREDKVVREGNARPKITDFKLFDIDGADVTDTIFAQQNDYVLLVVYSYENIDKWKAGAYKKIAESKAKNISVYVASASTVQAQQYFQGLTPLGCDAVVIKTIARTDGVFYLMNKANVKEKVGVWDAGK